MILKTIAQEVHAPLLPFRIVLESEARSLLRGRYLRIDREIEIRRLAPIMRNKLCSLLRLKMYKLIRIQHARVIEM